DLWALRSAAEAMARAGGAALEDDGADGTALRAWLYPTLVRAALSSREAESRPDDWDEQPLGELDPGWRDVALDPTPWQAALAAVAARLPASKQGALAAACGEVTDAAVLVRWLRLGMAPPASLEGLRPVDPPEVAVELAAHVDEGQARSLLREAVAAEGAAWRCVRGAEALDAERRVWLAEASASMSPLQRRLLLAHLLPLLEDPSAFFDEAAALLDPYVKGGEVSSEATYGSFPIASAMGALVAVADGATRLRWAEALTEIEAGPKAWLAVALVGALARGGDEARAWGLVTALEGVDERSHGEALVALGGAGDRRADERLAAGFAGFAERTREMLLREHPARLVEVLGSDVALAAACALPDGYVRVAALAALVPFLGSRAGEAAEAATAAYAAEPDGTTRIALLEVGAWLERPRAVALLREALEAHDSLGDALAGRTGVVGLLPLMAKVAGDGAATVAGVLLDVRRWMG
ncbi:MAG: hypothetical protein KC731_20010, partial [Myxococcales bacterium]|nr:hypothetical protein [Myxococcales bacterium]